MCQGDISNCGAVSQEFNLVLQISMSCYLIRSVSRSFPGPRSGLPPSMLPSSQTSTKVKREKERVLQLCEAASAHAHRRSVLSRWRSGFSEGCESQQRILLSILLTLLIDLVFAFKFKERGISSLPDIIHLALQSESRSYFFSSLFFDTHKTSLRAVKKQ